MDPQEPTITPNFKTSLEVLMFANNLPSLSAMPDNLLFKGEEYCLAGHDNSKMREVIFMNNETKKQLVFYIDKNFNVRVDYLDAFGNKTH